MISNKFMTAIPALLIIMGVAAITADYADKRRPHVGQCYRLPGMAYVYAVSEVKTYGAVVISTEASFTFYRTFREFEDGERIDCPKESAK